jgi:methionyl-tRNA formyltransferase
MKELYKSPLGTPVYADITFKAVTYTAPDGKVYNTEKQTYITVLISVTIPKIIIKTQIQGSDGSIKEYIGQDDAQVSINGVITGSNGEYPSEDVAKLNNMIQARVPIPVVCEFLNSNSMGIYNLVIESASLPQEAGRISQQAFTLNCISDTPTEIDFINA